MPLRDIFKRQVQDFLSSRPDRDRPSLADELRGEWDSTVERTLDPGREEREAAERAAELAEIRSQKGAGQPLRLDGYDGDWEAVETLNFDDTTVSFTLVDRRAGGWGQLSASDDGSVVLDVPDDQFAGTSPGAFWRTEGATGIRLDDVELSSDQRRVRVTCDLRRPSAGRPAVTRPLARWPLSRRLHNLSARRTPPRRAAGRRGWRVRFANPPSR